MNPFTIVHKLEDDLPRLAWSARVNLRDRSVVVRRGPWVETGPHFVVEGAWGGAFSAASFAEAPVFTGTGVISNADGLRFVSPTHTLQPLFTLRYSNELHCSNSLAFLLVAAGTTLQRSYRFYYYDFLSIIDGLRDYVRTVPTATTRVGVHYHCNLLLRPDGRLDQETKHNPPPFPDFAAYRAFLQDQVCRVAANATDSGRRLRYPLLTTISSGYDSPACAVLAQGAGCEGAITFTKARSDFAEREDSGRGVADHLGMKVIELDPDAYHSRTDMPEAEFIAAGQSGGDVVFTVAESELGGVLLLTGFHGDKIWSTHNDHVGPDIVRGDASGGSLSEFRLRVGFFNFPVPFAGCVRHPEIHAISNAAEMRPWSLTGTTYDRPIPRRIVETAGVPRQLFGQRKKAIAIPYHRTTRPSPPLRTVLTAASYDDFRRTTAGVPLFPTVIARARFAVLRPLYLLEKRIADSRRLARYCRRLRLPAHTHTWLSRRYGKPLMEHSLVFHWAFERIRRRYERQSRP
jgi:hypothetical protein